MEKAELIERLEGYEWNDIEFKEARHAVPKSAYETVSAFANTAGGHLVFGVKQNGEDFEVVGVLAVDKVQGDFLTALRQSNKISVILDVKEELHRQGDAELLVFFVPEASRAEKPVYLDGNINRSFVRRGGSDIRCSANERDRFLLDAVPERFDGRVVERDPDTAFDGDSIRWYRETYERRPGNRSHADLSDLDFLEEMGLVVERDGRRAPTLAAILMFGCNAAFRQSLPRPVVDCQRFTLSRNQADTGARWIDRTVLDENLIRTWRALVDWYERFAEHPFRIDPVTLQRDDTPPDYRAFRESMINLLMHQDYSDQGRKAEIRHYADQTVFWNPGDAFAATDLLEPGEKEVRNPRIVTAFRRIGLSENAGWGLRDVFRNWQELGNVPPRIANDKGRKCFELVLLKEELLSERQRLFQAQLGVRLTDEQARTFAFICRDGRATLSQLKAITELSAAKTLEVVGLLATQGLVTPMGASSTYVLAEHLEERFGGIADAGSGRLDLVTDQVDVEPSRLVTDQARPGLEGLSTAQAPVWPESLSTAQPPGTPKSLSTVQPPETPGSLSTAQAEFLINLSATQETIIGLCDTPRRLIGIMGALGVTNRGYFKQRHLDPLLRGGVLRMTHPDQPNHPEQAYVLTEAGVALKVRRASRDAGMNRGDRTDEA